MLYHRAVARPGLGLSQKPGSREGEGSSSSGQLLFFRFLRTFFFFPTETYLHKSTVTVKGAFQSSDLLPFPA